MLMSGFEWKTVRNPITNGTLEETPKLPRALAKARAHRG